MLSCHPLEPSNPCNRQSLLAAINTWKLSPTAYHVVCLAALTSECLSELAPQTLIRYNVNELSGREQGTMIFACSLLLLHGRATSRKTQLHQFHYHRSAMYKVCIHVSKEFSSTISRCTTTKSCLCVHFTIMPKYLQLGICNFWCIGHVQCFGGLEIWDVAYELWPIVRSRGTLLWEALGKGCVLHHQYHHPRPAYWEGTLNRYLSWRVQLMKCMKEKHFDGTGLCISAIQAILLFRTNICWQLLLPANSWHLECNHGKRCQWLDFKHLHRIIFFYAQFVELNTILSSAGCSLSCIMWSGQRAARPWS